MTLIHTAQSNRFFTLFFILSISINFSLFSQTDVESFRKHINFLAADSIQGRGIGTKKMDLVRSYIARNFRMAGLKPLRYDFILPFSGYTSPIRYDGYNIAGMLEGSDPVLKDEIIVLAAHYDHLGYYENATYNGANDNASGVAILMELAKELYTMRSEINRSILFVAFDAEEAGLVGSFNFIKEDSLLLPKIQMMFSIDMVGTYKESKSLILTGFDLLNIDKMYCKDIAVINDINIETTKKYEFRTDTYPFLKSGITSVHMTTSDDKNYHQTTDIPDNIDYEGLYKIFNFSTDLILKLNSEKKELFTKVTDLKQVKLIPNFRYGYTAGIGSSYFNYVDDFYQAKNTFSGLLGITAEQFLFKNFSLNTGLYYAFTGSRHEFGTYRAHSVEIPVNIIFTTSDRTVFAKAFLIAGGYFAKHFYQTVSKKSVDTKDIFNVFDVGLNLGFGFDIDNFQISFTAKNGLYDQHLSRMNEKIWTNRFTVNLTYYRK
jgi:hypothetical protein